MRRETWKRKMIDPPDVSTWSLTADTKPVPEALAVIPESPPAVAGAFLPQSLRTGPDENMTWATRMMMERSAR